MDWLSHISKAVTYGVANGCGSPANITKAKRILTTFVRGVCPACTGIVSIKAATNNTPCLFVIGQHIIDGNYCSGEGQIPIQLVD